MWASKRGARIMNRWVCIYPIVSQLCMFVFLMNETEMCSIRINQMFKTYPSMPPKYFIFIQYFLSAFLP